MRTSIQCSSNYKQNFSGCHRKAWHDTKFDTLNYFTDVFKIYGPIFQNIWPARYRVQNRLHDVWGRQEGVNDDNVDITTGVTTRFPRGVDGDQAGYDGIRPATQVGRRGVGGCLGGHDDGVSMVDEGAKHIDLTSKAGTTGSVGIGHYQWFH